MVLAKLCGFLATSVLPLILLVDSTAEGCVTEPDYKSDYCPFDIVIKGSVLNDNKEDTPLNFKITQVIKGPSDMGKNVKINTEKCYLFPDDIDIKEFLILGSKGNGEIVCAGAQPDFKITVKEAEVLRQISSNGCN